MGYVVTRDNIMDILVLAANDNLESTDISFSDDFRIHIKINGEKWTGSVNYIIAQYIIKLQRDILSIHNKLFPDEHLSLKSIKKIDRSLLVDVEIKEGCTEILAWLKETVETQLDKVISKGMDKMSSKELFALILILYALYCGKDIILEDIRIDNETKVRIEQTTLEKLREINDQETRQLLINQVGTALEIVKDNSEGFRYLRSNMDVEDSISAVDFDKSLSGYEIKGKKRDKTDKSTVYIDGKYKLNSIRITPNTATICSDSGDYITASIDMLSDADKITLHDMNKDGDLHSECPTVGLHVTVQLKDGTPDGYAIVGVNPSPRPGSKPFKSVHGPQKIKSQKGPADFPLSKLMNTP